MEKKKFRYFLGSILFILGIFLIILATINSQMYGGSCPTCVILEDPFFWVGLFCLLLGLIILGITGYSSYKRRKENND
ncbi:MAG: hypothetical protein ACW98D_13050 [Promethearchaeota archaeon]